MAQYGIQYSGDVVASRIKISNDRLWQIAQDGEDIDLWLMKNVGYRNYKEWIGLNALPYRSFSFTYEKDAVLFSLRWL